MLEFIKLIEGKTKPADIEITPYDLSRGRIVRRK
jgi:translation initiation factor IF-1